MTSSKPSHRLSQSLPKLSQSSSRPSPSSPRTSQSLLWAGLVPGCVLGWSGRGRGLTFAVKTCGFRTIWNSLSMPREPPEPPEPAKWWQDPRVGPPIPHALGARMAAVTQTPSNKTYFQRATQPPSYPISPHCLASIPSITSDGSKQKTPEMRA